MELEKNCGINKRNRANNKGIAFWPGWGCW